MASRAKYCVIILGIISATVYTQDSITQCTVEASPVNPSVAPVKLRVEHLYESNTNGQPYGPITRATADLSLPASGEVQTQQFENTEEEDETLSATFDGVQVCAFIRYKSSGEACIEQGCMDSDTTYTCEEACFPASDVDTRHRLNFYYSIKSSMDIGTWTARDYLMVYLVEEVERRCYQQDTYYHYSKYSEPSIPEVTCPLGQRCRVTAVYVGATSDARYYIGCEEKRDHADGCEWQGCRSKVREPIPGSSSYFTFHQICRYCCTGQLCNDVRQCSGSVCNFNDGDGDGQDDDSPNER